MSLWLLLVASGMEERVRLLEEALQQTVAALRDSQSRVTALESAGPPPPPQATGSGGSPAAAANMSLVDMRMLGKPAMFSGDRGLARLVLYDEGLRGGLDGPGWRP